MFKLVGDLGPVILQQGSTTILGRRTHNLIHKEKRCSRNQMSVTVSDDGEVTIEYLGLNPGQITAKGKSKSKTPETKTRVPIQPGDVFTLFATEYPFTLVEATGGANSNGTHKQGDSDTDEDPQLHEGKRKRDSDDEEEESAPKKAKKGEKVDSDGEDADSTKKAKKHKAAPKDDSENEGSESDSHTPTKHKKSKHSDDDEGKETCKFGAKCYRKNKEHLAQFYHPPASPTKSASSASSSSSPSTTTTTTTATTFLSKSKGWDGVYYKTLAWRQHESVIILDKKPLPPADKIAAFDMDYTLIKTKSGNVFAKSRDDWEWLYKQVPKKLQELYNDGYRLMIFSNQNGAGKSQNINDLKGKVMDIISAIKVPIITFLSTGKDHFRKPRTSVYDYMITDVNSGVTPSEVFYVGDAAGRDADDDLRPKKDFSSSDREFAANLGIPFHTPEEFFLGHKPAKFKFEFDPHAFKNETRKAHNGETPLTSVKQEMILLVGMPASGKSTFAKKYLIPKGYVHVNNDTLKTKEKCMKTATTAINEGKSVVIDNTNPSPDTRQEYINIAKSKKIPVRCFFFNTTPQLSAHLNKFREMQTKGETKLIPKIAYNMYTSKFKKPSTSEGFTEVKDIHFVPDFTSEKHEKLFYQYY